MLDLSNNKLDDPEIVPQVLKHLVNLKLLKLEGNPVVKKIKNYRKTVLGAMKQLNCLDQMPVFEKERRLVAAWERGGLKEEQDERERISEEEKERARQNFWGMLVANLITLEQPISLQLQMK